MVRCDWFGRNRVGEWGMSPPPPSNEYVFPWWWWRRIISPLIAASYPKQAMKIDPWCLSVGRVWSDWSKLSGGVRMSPPPPSGFLYFPVAAQWRYNIATLAWMFQSRTMEIDNWFYSTTICDGRSHLRAWGWRQRRGHSHRWRGIISIIMIVANIITFWWQRWRSVNCRL